MAMARRDFKIELGDRLRLAREKTKINGKKATQERVTEWLASNLENTEAISYQTLSDYERGRTSPPPQTLAALARLYNVSCDYLLQNTDFENPANQDIKMRLGLSDSAINELEWMTTTDNRAEELKASDEEYKEARRIFTPHISAINLLITMGRGLLTKIFDYLYGGYDIQFFDVDLSEITDNIIKEGTRTCFSKAISLKNSKNNNSAGFYISEISDEILLLQIQKSFIEIRNTIQNKEG